MRKFLLLLMVMFFLWANINVYPKCPLAKYTINGIIKEIATNKAIEGAKVFVFLDDYEETSLESYMTKHPDFFETSTEGKFEAISYFDTFKKVSLFGDDCSKKPKSLGIFITKDGYVTKRKKFTDKEFKVIDRGEVKAIEIPEIHIKPTP